MKTIKIEMTNIYRVEDRTGYTKMGTTIKYLDGERSSDFSIDVSHGQEDPCGRVRLTDLDEVRMLRDLLNEVLEGEQ